MSAAEITVCEPKRLPSGSWELRVKQRGQAGDYVGVYATELEARVMWKQTHEAMMALAEKGR